MKQEEDGMLNVFLRGAAYATNRNRAETKYRRAAASLAEPHTWTGVQVSGYWVPAGDYGYAMNVCGRTAKTRSGLVIQYYPGWEVASDYREPITHWLVGGDVPGYDGKTNIPHVQRKKKPR